MKQTQSDKVLQYIVENGSITPYDAMRDLSCMRLGARIADLRAAGYDIQTDFVTGKNRFGDVTHYARYSMREGAKS